MLRRDEREVRQRLARTRLPVRVALARALLEHAFVEHPPDERAEARRAGVLEEALAEVERDPAGRLDEVERLGEGGRRDVAEPERGDARHEVEAVALELPADL